MSRRILDETTKSTFASDDYLYMDGQTDGSSKITPDNLVRNTTVAQQLAQHIADAEDDVEQITSDIETIQGDITDLRSDLGDLSELETTDKSSIVNAINEARGSGGGSVPSTVRSAIFALFDSGAFAEAGLTDELAIVESWAEEVTDITLNSSTISISGASTSQLTATTVPSGVTVSWSSSNTAVATVSSSGLVTGVGNGTATITASAGDMSATCTATVSGFATLTSISAVYTQSGTVYDTDTLDSLKADLVVTAVYSDSSTSTVASTDYTLSGTLTEGTSTITVAYGGKTTTFTVTVDVDSRLTTSAYITVANETLTDGYINDNGEVTSASNNYFIDKYYNALPIAVTNGADIARIGMIRTAYYDTNYSFVSRNYQQGSYIKEVSESSAVYEKIGWQGTAPTIICLLNDAMDNSLFVNAGKTLDSSGNLTDESIQNATDLLPIDNGCDKWYIYSNNSYNTIKIAFYDSSGNFISRVYKSDGYACGDIPATAVYYRVSKGTNYSTTYHVLMKGI